MERLLEAGALDVTLTPIFMKKNRPGTLVSVIATPELAEQLAAILFAETTTLGVRILQAERRVLARSIARSGNRLRNGARQVQRTAAASRRSTTIAAKPPTDTRRAAAHRDRRSQSGVSPEQVHS